jgi:prenylcysteine oxidase / farnesylcysteine lyase
VASLNPNLLIRIYKLQEEGNIFTNINELLWAMDPSFLDMLERSLEAGLKEEGIADIFIQELAVAVMRVNYGQSVDAHQFVG